MTASRNSSQKNPFPYFLKELRQLPSSLLKLAEELLPQIQVIEGIFVVPSGLFPRGLRLEYIPLHALVFTDQGIFYLSEPAKQNQPKFVIWLMVDEIIKVTTSVVLLNSLLEIWGIRDNKIIHISMDYNTVGHSMLLPMIFSLLRKMWLKNTGILNSLPVEDTFRTSGIPHLVFIMD